MLALLRYPSSSARFQSLPQPPSYCCNLLMTVIRSFLMPFNVLDWSLYMTVTSGLALTFHSPAHSPAFPPAHSPARLTLAHLPADHVDRVRKHAMALAGHSV